MTQASSHETVLEALRDIVIGKVVKRIKHDLVYEGRDFTAEFIEALMLQGYRTATVEEVRVQPGERVPAFFIDRSTVYFGWVFWEQFTSSKLRKLWGSAVKNALGDWEIQIPRTRKTIVYANEMLKLEMDIDHPPEF